MGKLLKSHSYTCAHNGGRIRVRQTLKLVELLIGPIDFTFETLLIISQFVRANACALVFSRVPSVLNVLITLFTRIVLLILFLAI